jgi:hypothetical protein
MAASCPPSWSPSSSSGSSSCSSLSSSCSSSSSDDSDDDCDSDEEGPRPVAANLDGRHLEILKAEEGPDAQLFYVRCVK